MTTKKKTSTYYTINRVHCQSCRTIFWKSQVCLKQWCWICSRCKTCYTFLQWNRFLKRTDIMPTKKARAQCAGCKQKANEVRLSLFNWFIDINETLKGRLPRRIFKMRANQLYEEWLTQNPLAENEGLKFSNQWVKEWKQEYGISLREPNKKYSIKKEDLVQRLQDYLKNVWRVRFFIEKYGFDPPVINGDQMALHRNEGSQQKNNDF